MPKPPAITQAEWDVMDVVWQRAEPVAASEIVEALAGRRAWNPRTVKTLLARLVKKGALAAAAADGNRYLYRARVPREACARAESQSFLSRICAGRVGEMLCRFVDEAELSADELAALREVLDRKADAPTKRRGGRR